MTTLSRADKKWLREMAGLDAESDQPGGNNVSIFELSNIPGQGRGSPIPGGNIRDIPFTEPSTGIEVLSCEGYSDDEDDDFDDFGDPLYICTVKGTKAQVLKFIKLFNSSEQIEFEEIDD